VSDQHRHDDNASPLFLLLSTNGLPSSIGQLRRWPCPHSNVTLLITKSPPPAIGQTMTSAQSVA